MKIDQSRIVEVTSKCWPLALWIIDVNGNLIGIATYDHYTPLNEHEAKEIFYVLNGKLFKLVTTTHATANTTTTVDPFR